MKFKLTSDAEAIKNDLSNSSEFILTEYDSSRLLHICKNTNLSLVSVLNLTHAHAFILATNNINTNASNNYTDYIFIQMSPSVSGRSVCLNLWFLIRREMWSIWMTMIMHHFMWVAWQN